MIKRQLVAKWGYYATDAVLELVVYVGEGLIITTAMIVDVKSAFNNVKKKKNCQTYKRPDCEINALGLDLDRKLEFKAHDEEIANKAKRILRAIGVFGDTVRGVRGSSMKSMYLLSEHSCGTVARVC